MMALSRRSFLSMGASAAVAFAGRSASAWPAANEAQVKTRFGTLVGEKEEGVRVFRGVPFAQPPVGALRFKPPQELRPWIGVRDARQFSEAAMQPGEKSLKQSEDCLYLNIWAPSVKGPHPVFVWIHGGGFTGGHAFAPIFDGTEFAQAGIVVVTVAYRLGVFGFLDMEPLLGAEFAGSGNNSLRDLVAALRWVHNNIDSFGGDPTKVTLGGESAGAKLTDILMGTPEATPFFQQMISESGGAERIWTRAAASSVSRGFGDLWTKERAENPVGLRTDAPEAVIRVQEKFTATWPQHFPLRCEVEGALLPRLPIDQIAGGSTKGKRLLIGTNRDESALFLGPHPQKDATAGDLGNLSTGRFEEVYARYGEVYPNMAVEQRRIRAVTAEEYWIPSVRVVDAHVNAGGRAWMYRLDFAPGSGRFAGEAYHSLDLGLVWDKPDNAISNADDEALLSKKVHATWAAFIRGGAPSSGGLPEWPSYLAESRATMILDKVSRVELHPTEAELKLWHGLL